MLVADEGFRVPIVTGAQLAVLTTGLSVSDHSVLSGARTMKVVVMLPTGFEPAYAASPGQNAAAPAVAEGAPNRVAASGYLATRLLNEVDPSDAKVGMIVLESDVRSQVDPVLT